MKDGAEPYVLNAPWRIAIPLRPAVEKELKRMEDQGVIARIEEPTDWCAGMVIVPKANGKVRICVDLTKLNESVCRDIFCQMWNRLWLNWPVLRCLPN